MMLQTKFAQTSTKLSRHEFSYCLGLFSGIFHDPITDSEYLACIIRIGTALLHGTPEGMLFFYNLLKWD
jgi:hypothetical protein